MTTVLIVHPRPTRGGFSAVVAQASELARLDGIRVHVAVARGRRVAELPASVTVHALDAGLTSLRGAFQLNRLVKRLEPAIVHLHGRQAGFVGRIVTPTRSMRIFYTPHGTPWSNSSWVRDFLADVAERLLLRRTDQVLCVSRAEQADWVRRDVSERVRYFPNLIAAPSAQVVPNGPSQTHDGGLLVPSGYNKQKRIEVVIEALSRVPSPRPRLTICGSVDDHDYKTALQSLASRSGVLDSVVFEDDVENIKSRLASAGLVILPSYTEGMPIIGQEAVLVGARVAWSAIPPHFELFAEYGAPFWDADELAQIIGADWDALSVSARTQALTDDQKLVMQQRALFWHQALGLT